MKIIIILGVVVLVIIVFAVVTSNAPYGYEDENGFHFGKKE